MKLFLPPLLAVSAVLAVVAQPPMAELGNLTATAVLGWYAWHTASRTIPHLMDGFRAELAAERVQHREDRDAFLRQLVAERIERREDSGAMVEALRLLSDKLEGRAPHAHDASLVTHCSSCLNQKGEDQ